MLSVLLLASDCLLSRSSAHRHSCRVRASTFDSLYEVSIGYDSATKGWSQWSCNCIQGTEFEAPSVTSKQGRSLQLVGMDGLCGAASLLTVSRRCRVL